MDKKYFQICFSVLFLANILILFCCCFILYRIKMEIDSEKDSNLIRVYANPKHRVLIQNYADILRENEPKNE